MKSAVHSRALFVCLALVAGFSVLSVRLVYVQWIDRETLARKASQAQFHTEVLPGWFGNIVDRHGEILARNVPVTTIVADKNHLRNLNAAARGVAYANLVDSEEWIHGSRAERRTMLRREARRLQEVVSEGELLDSYIEHAISITARALGMPARELEAKLGTDLKEVIIAKDLREDEADEIEETLEENHVFGFYFRKSVKRWYAVSRLATHTTGYVNHKGEGQCGIEAKFSRYLRGEDGERTTRKDHTGLMLLEGTGKLRPPRSGLDVRLTLDLAIQSIVEEELDWGLGEFESKRGAVVMLDPKTGDVLAIASRPHFDLNERKDADKHGMNYAVQGIYEPGSTFKIISAAAALDLGIMNPWDEVFCHNGYMSMPGGYVKDYKGFGNLSLEEVLAKSSNIGAYKIGLRVNPSRYMDYLRKFGFRKQTGIELSGEQRGLITDHTNGVNFSRITFGYGVAVTPLQVACAYAAIANDGVRMKPRIVHSLLANDGSEVERIAPEEAERVISKATARKMRHALETVVNPEGKGNTGKRASVPGYLVCGKTGTARILENGIYVTNRYAVSFAGFMPRDNPAFVCVVVIHDPLTKKLKVGGGSVAAPVFQRIAARTADYLNLTPTEPVEDEVVEDEEALAGAEPSNP